MSIYQVLTSNPAKKIYLITGFLIYKGRDIVNYLRLLLQAIEEIDTPLKFFQFIGMQLCIAFCLLKLGDVFIPKLLQFHRTWWTIHRSDTWRFVATIMVVMTTHIVLEFDYNILLTN